MPSENCKYPGMSCTIVLPTNNSCLYAEGGQATGSSLVAPGTVTHYIPVMNQFDATWTSYEGTRLVDVFPVKSLKTVQEMLWVEPQLSDWESDEK